MSNIVKVRALKTGSFNGFIRFKNTKDSISPMYDYTGTIVTGLTEDDAARLGKKLNKDLSPSSSFWHEYRVIMTDKEKIFNMSNAEHELAVLFLRGDKRIANSQEDLDKGLYPYAKYVIYDEEKAASDKNKEYTVKRKATIEFSKLSTGQMIDILKLYPGFVNLTSVTPDVVESSLFELLEKDPAKFLTLIGDKKLDMKVFLKDLVNNKVLRKNKTAFYYGEDFLGHDEESTIAFLEDPKHQSLKIEFAEQIAKLKK
jgi:hypothetical protein